MVGIILFGAAILFAVTAFPLLVGRRRNGNGNGNGEGGEPPERDGTPRRVRETRAAGPLRTTGGAARSGPWLPKAVPIV